METKELKIQIPEGYENKCFVSKEEDAIYIIKVGDYNPYLKAFNVVSEMYFTKLYFHHGYKCFPVKKEELDDYKEIPENIYNTIECILQRADKNEDTIRKIISNHLFFECKKKLANYE